MIRSLDFLEFFSPQISSDFSAHQNENTLLTHRQAFRLHSLYYIISLYHRDLIVDSSMDYESRDVCVGRFTRFDGWSYAEFRRVDSCSFEQEIF